MASTPSDTGFDSPEYQGKTLSKVFSVIRYSISILTNDPETKTKEYSEKILSDNFIHLLEQCRAHIGYRFYFHKESNEQDDGHSPQNDFAVFPNQYKNGPSVLFPSKRKAIIRFEAKRLSANLTPNRNQEYVIGEYSKEGKKVKNSGGIERFKNGNHGSQESIAGMVGYVQTHHFSHWLSVVNTIIADEISKSHDPALVWSSADLLVISSENSNCWELESNSMRKGGLGSVRLKHFWIDICPNGKD